MARKEYKGAAAQTTLVAGITSGTTSFSITSSTGWPTGAVGSFTCVIDPGTSSEEKIFCSALSGGVLTVTTRGYDNTTATAHSTGAVIYPVPSAIDFDEANAHIVASTGVHGLSGAVVGTTDTQTLTNKALSDATTTFVDSVDATKVLKIDVTGTTAVTGTLTSAFTTAKTLTLPDATDTLVGKATTDTLTNKTMTSPKELTTVSATSATGTVNCDLLTQGVLYYTSSAGANWTLNFRGNSGTTLNSLMNTGDAWSFVFLNTNGATPYYPTTFQVDGTATGVTVKWSGGTAPSAGNASAIDAYTFTIIKTAGTPTYTILAGGAVKFA